MKQHRKKRDSLFISRLLSGNRQYLRASYSFLCVPKEKNQKKGQSNR